ncbi:hypothetical protein OB08_07860 [Microbacterium sp. HJ5]
MFVTAPAGYGKTTLLSEWTAIDERPAVWATLRGCDDDPAELAALLASSFNASRQIAPSGRALLRGLGVAPLGQAAPTTEAVLEPPEPYLFILDDVQVVESTAGLELLEVVLSRIPDGSTVVLSSRVRLARLERAFRPAEAVVIGLPDLSFDGSLARRVFAQRSVDITLESASALAARAGGWPMGVVLAARVADDAGQIVDVSGSSQPVTAYLAEEVFSLTHPRDRRFLMATSIMSDLSGPDCDSLLRTEGSSDRLDRLAAGHVFLIRTACGHRYRLNQLVRESLLAEFEVEDPDSVRELRGRAGDLFIETDRPTLAMDQFIAGGHRRRAAILLAEIGRRMFSTGRYATIDRWAKAIGDAEIHDHPSLIILSAWNASLQGRDEEADRWMAQAESIAVDVAGPESPGFHSMLSMLRAGRYESGAEAAHLEALAALEAEGPQSPLRDGALWLLGQAQVLLGQRVEAEASFKRASTAATRLGHPNGVVYAESDLMILAMDDGRWDEASVHLDAAMSNIERFGLWEYQSGALTFAAAARLAAYRPEATADLGVPMARGMRSRLAATAALPSLAVRTRLQLIRAASEPSMILRLLSEIDDVYERRPSLGVLDAVVAEVREAYCAQQMSGSGLAPLTPAELRVLPYLQTHLTVDEIAHRLQVSRHTVGSHMRAIYAKLLVTSRSEAVQRAIAVGLLG